MVEGGGSLHPHDADRLFFSGDTYNLKKVIYKVAPEFVYGCLEEAGINLDDVNMIISHQVSKTTASSINEKFPIGMDNIMDTFARFGNTASSSLPIALEKALDEGRLKKGDLVLLLGLAAGINISMHLYRV